MVIYVDPNDRLLFDRLCGRENGTPKQNMKNLYEADKILLANTKHIHDIAFRHSYNGIHETKEHAEKVSKMIKGKL